MASRVDKGVTPRQRGYDTNLASEFYVLSALHRLGLDATLTLGNKKGVDLVVACGPGRAYTVEVKAVKGKNDWLVGSLGGTPRDHHFVVLVCYEGVFENPDSLPSVWVYPHVVLAPLVRVSKNGSAQYLSRKEIRETGGQYAQAWDLLRDASSN
jgi:hypothetical protein